MYSVSYAHNEGARISPVSTCAQARLGLRNPLFPSSTFILFTFHFPPGSFLPPCRCHVFPDHHYSVLRTYHLLTQGPLEFLSARRCPRIVHSLKTAPYVPCSSYAANLRMKLTLHDSAASIRSHDLQSAICNLRGQRTPAHFSSSSLFSFSRSQFCIKPNTRRHRPQTRQRPTTPCK